MLAVLYKSYDLLDCHYVYILTDMLNFTIVVSISCGIAGYMVVAMKWRSEDDNGSTYTCHKYTNNWLRLILACVNIHQNTII